MEFHMLTSENVFTNMPPSIPAPAISGEKKSTLQRCNIFIGPLLYFVMLMLPLGGTLTQQGGLGIILWAVWYWGTGCVPTGYVIVVPIIGTAFLPGMKFAQILQTLIHPGLPMLLGPALIVCMWSRWGFTRRMALLVLKKVGTSVRAQAVCWVILSTTVSFFAANVVIAIALTPIALEILKAVGYDSPKKLLASKSSMLIIIAIGVGASLGGFLTPMAGGQAVITWQQLNESIGQMVPMASFASVLVVPVFLSIIPVVALFAFCFPIDVKHFEGSKEIFREKLAEMGPISKAEIAGALIFAFAILLPFLQPLWRPYLPKSLDINPSLIFGTITGILCLLPAPDQGAAIKPFAYEPGERLLSMRSVNILPVQAFLIWPTAMSIATLVNITGASTLLSGILGNYWELPPYTGVGLFVLFCLIMGNVASDTGAAGMLAPVIAAATAASGQNPVPWLLMMGYTVNFSFMVPTATGTMALPIALGGKASWRLPVYGFFCAVGCGLVSWLFWGTVFAFDLQFWMHF
jgi:sodium-dependent dicarboxylate transporter 2/3/5